MRSSTALRAMLAMTREANSTNALTTPWMSVIVTMSPLAMCDSSWASTPSTSSRRMPRSSPLDTATRLFDLLGPVANAFTSGES